MPSWLPDREADRLTWLQNFALKLNTYVGTAGITAADVTMVNAFLAAYQWLLNRSDQLKNASQDMTAYKSIATDGPIGTVLGGFPVAPVYPMGLLSPISAGIFPQITALAERIRNTAGYTLAIGQDLGIVGPGSAPPLGDPTFTVTALPNSEARLDWVKGSSDGVIVESQRGDEVTWTVLGTDNFSPYLDGRPPLVAGAPEVRRYRIRYRVGDDPVGNYSAVVSITTVP